MFRFLDGWAVPLHRHKRCERRLCASGTREDKYRLRNVRLVARSTIKKTWRRVGIPYIATSLKRSAIYQKTGTGPPFATISLPLAIDAVDTTRYGVTLLPCLGAPVDYTTSTQRLLLSPHTLHFVKYLLYPSVRKGTR